MCFGFFLVDFNDFICEGDGKCFVNLYKIVVLLYKYYGYIKYVYIIFLFLIKVKVILLVERVESLIVNRFCNSYGKFGKNIFMDLFFEYENKFVKFYIDFLGFNFKEELV